MRIIDQPVEKTEKDDQQKLGFWMLLGTAQNMMSDVGLYVAAVAWVPWV